MAELKFAGVVRGYSQGDDGMIHLAIDDPSPSEKARFYVHDLERSFNPHSPNHGYGAKDVPCNIRPGFSAYRFTVPAETARNITHGLYVDVVIDLYHIRKVRFYNRKWAGIPELRYDLVSIKPVPVEVKPEPRPEMKAESKPDKAK